MPHSDADSATPDLVLACRILAAHGHEHGPHGHVSVRTPEGGFVLKANRIGLSEVEGKDFVRVSPEGEADDPSRLHAEAPIHAQIYAAREGVGAIVHTHHGLVAALTASEAPFAMVSQDSVHLWGRLSRYPESGLISTRRRGQQLADCLGHGRAVLLDNHGLVTVGTSLREAVFFAVSLGRSVQTQYAASQFGSLRPMDEGDVRDVAADFDASLERRVDQAWDHWVRSLVSFAAHGIVGPDARRMP